MPILTAALPRFPQFRQRCLQFVGPSIEIEAHIAFSRVQSALFVEIRLVTNPGDRGVRAVKHLQLREQRRRVAGRPIVIYAKPQLVLPLYRQSVPVTEVA